MSYPMSLDEYTDAELQAELDRRYRDRRAGKCDYCHRPFTSMPACKFPERHKGNSR